MNEYVVTCCSTADLSKAELDAMQIPYTMFHYQLNGRQLPDDLYTTVTPEAFFNGIAAGDEPVTSQVNAEEYASFWEPMLVAGKDILHLTLSSGISGTYNSACIARDELAEKYPDRTIEVIDSLSASSGYGLLVDAAYQNKKHGMSLAQNRAWLMANRNRQHSWFFSTDLTSYIRGGRVSKASGFVGKMLSICPLLRINRDGQLIPTAKIRGKKAVIQEIVNRMVEHAAGGAEYTGKVFLSHSNCLADAEAVAQLVEQKFPLMDGKPVIHNIGAVIGSHTGPGTVALFFWGDEKQA